MAKKISLAVLFSMVWVAVCIARPIDLPDDPNVAVVEKIHDCNDCESFVFRCDIKNYPPICGINMPVKIRNVSQTSQNDIDIIAKKIKTELNKAVEANRKITLRNMQRDPQQFRIIADVYIDDKNLAEKLIENGIAKNPPKEKLVKLSAVQEIERQDKPTLDEIKQAGFAASKNGKVFHRKDCNFAKKISSENLTEYPDRQQAEADGKRPCKTCKP